MNECVIKWSGSKRYQANQIVSLFPAEIDTYYEPFIGGGSVLLCLLQSKEHNVTRYICSDLNADLINLWNAVMKNPKDLIADYTEKWTHMKSLTDIDAKRAYYNSIRDLYNSNRSAFDFHFLTRFAFNGLIRYNSSGGFNSPYHYGRDGIIPESLRDIILEASNLLNQYDIQFICQDYSAINPQSNDFCYFDPPYAGVKKNAMYLGNFDSGRFFSFIQKFPCRFALSYDGYTDGVELHDNHIEIEQLNHQFIKSGKSSYGRLVTEDAYDVFDSLYLNYEPIIKKEVQKTLW